MLNAISKNTPSSTCILSLLGFIGNRSWEASSVSANIRSVTLTQPVLNASVLPPSDLISLQL